MFERFLFIFFEFLVCLVELLLLFCFWFDLGNFEGLLLRILIWYLELRLEDLDIFIFFEIEVWSCKEEFGLRKCFLLFKIEFKFILLLEKVKLLNLVLLFWSKGFLICWEEVCFSFIVGNRVFVVFRFVLFMNFFVEFLDMLFESVLGGEVVCFFVEFSIVG